MTYWNGNGSVVEGCGKRWILIFKIGKLFFFLSDSDDEYICNCDSKDEGVSDIGILTAKSDLPVQMLSFGDDEKPYAWKQYSLGPLVCNGKASSFPSEQEKLQKYEEFSYAIDKNKENIIVLRNVLTS